MRRQQEVMHGPQAVLNSIENKSRDKQKLTSHKQPSSQTSQSTQSMPSQSSHKQPIVQQQQFVSSDRCKWCGRDRHDRNSCPTLKAKCRACGTMGHFACVCRKKTTACRSCTRWLNTCQHLVNGSAPLLIQAESGADVCCISVEHHLTLCTQQCACTLQQSNRLLHGPDGRRLEVRGSFKATLEYHGRRVDMTTYVLPNVDTPLLSRQASTQLGIVASLDAVSDTIGADQCIMHQYPRLFRDLGCISEPYRIQLKSDAQPYAVYAPGHILCHCCQRLRMKLTDCSASASSSMLTSLHSGVHLLL